MIQITKIWFSGDWMYGLDDSGKQYRQSVLWYRRLADATPGQRNSYTLSIDGIHWRAINEDISFDSFVERNNIEPNAMQRFFLTHREINLSQFSQLLGINPSLMRDYINGWKTPSPQRKEEIINGIRSYVNTLQSISF